ncbi:MAG: cache domain-containing protein [candidate division WOR-3 bacterium]
MKLGLTAKLSLGFLFVIILVGVLAILAGTNMIANGIIQQAQNKVKSDLNAAREIYQEYLGDIKDVIRLHAERILVREAIKARDKARLISLLGEVRFKERLDILTITDNKGQVILRLRNPKVSGDQPNNELLRRVLEQKEVMASTLILSKEELIKEGEDLANQAYFKILPTPKAKPTTKEEETSGMVLLAAVPIFDNNGNFIGVLYGGRLLNRDYTIVDKIKNVVFQSETYKGKDIGTATIFQGDLRISTNVRQLDGTRAVGTRIAANVYDQVLVRGKSYTDRAFVVNNWYITAYEPIRDLFGNIIGVLYVGILEDKFADLRRNAVMTFLAIVVAGIVIAFVISHLLARSILKPLKAIVDASKRIAGGNFNYQVKIKTRDELSELGESFNFMVASLKERDERLKEVTRQQLMRSERLATLGQLAAGVAHEINNPIAGILTYIRLIRKKLEKSASIGDGDFKRYLAIMERETDRCGTIVRNLLDFARQSEPNLKSVDVNMIINESLELLDHKLRLQNIEVEKRYAKIPLIIGDFAQLQQSFMNIILNAAEAMENGGKLTITTRTADTMVEIEFADTGKGIPQENLTKIFEPFFTTKPKGTGLGLSVVFGIINRHQGEIDVKSEVGKGTTFIIRLPKNIK